MALTLQSEIDIVNLALDKIAAAGNIILTNQTSVQAVSANLHYPQIRDALFRSYYWNFAKKRAVLKRPEFLEVDAAPTVDPFAVGDILTGDTSGETCKVITVLSDTLYEIIDRSGDFEDGEEIGNGTDSVDCGAGYPIVAENTPVFKWGHQYLLPSDFARLVSVYEDDGSDCPEFRYSIEGNRLLTDYQTCHITYISIVNDPSLWDSLFREVFILRLALSLFHPLAGTAPTDLKAELKQELMMAESRARVANADDSDTSGMEYWNKVRYGA